MKLVDVLKIIQENLAGAAEDIPHSPHCASYELGKCSAYVEVLINKLESEEEKE